MKSVSVARFAETTARRRARISSRLASACAAIASVSGEPECFRNEVLPERPADPEPDDQRPVIPRHRHPTRTCRDAADDRHEEQRPEHRRGAGIRAGQDADRDRIERIADCRSERGQPADGDQAAAGRLQDDNHADQADQHREPLLPADAFTEHGHRQRRDQQRRRHENAVRVRKRELAHGVNEAPQQRDAEEAAHQVQAPAPGLQIAPTTKRGIRCEQQRQRGGTTEEGHLHCREVLRQPLQQDIHHRERGDGR